MPVSYTHLDVYKRQDYNCALEPATGFYDDVPRAIKNGTIRVLEPGGEFAFTLEISLRKEKHCLLYTSRCV